MGGYLILQWSPDREALQHVVARVKDQIDRKDQDKLIGRPGLLVAGFNDRLEEIAPGTYILGHVFSGGGRAGVMPVPVAQTEAGFDAWCRTILSRCWGSYVAIRHAPEENGALSVLTEPMGMRDCVAWEHEGIRFLTSDPDHWLKLFPPETLAVDQDAVAHLLAYPATASEAKPLTGLTVLDPGTLTHFSRSAQKMERLWVPRDFCRRDARPADPDALAQLVDDCLAAWNSLGGPAVLELSGGLDSAIVAASAVKAGFPIERAFTFFSDTLSGDERRFSRAIAARLDIDALEIPLALQPLEADPPASHRTGIRPGIGAGSFFHDRRLAQEAVTIGAALLLTGRGGDALFFQHPTAQVAAEPWAQGQFRSRARLEALARWTQSPIWRVIKHVGLPGSGRRQSDFRPSRFATFDGLLRPMRWPGRLDGLSSAKQMQVMAIAGDRSAFGPSHCSGALEVIHPLLSQPLVEYALGQSIMVLTDGRRDRALARAAFADRLPAAIIERPGKGALSGYFGRVLATSVETLRIELLEGALAKAGLVDRAALEQVLDTDYLIREDCYSELLTMLEIERWVQAWQARLGQGPS